MKFIDTIMSVPAALGLKKLHEGLQKLLTSKVLKPKGKVEINYENRK